MPKIFFENTKTKKRYELVNVSEDGSTVTLKGEYGEFKEPYDKPRFKALGYRLVQEPDPEQEDAE